MLAALGSLFYLVPVSFNAKHLEDVPDYISEAVPWFLLLMLLEFLYGKWRGYELYTLKDTLMSWSLGITQQLLGLFVKQISAVPYAMVYAYFAPLRAAYYPQYFSASSLPYVYFLAAMLGVDFGYYWFHRFAHEWHLLWASHSVHHSGERYNLATALRQGTTQSMFSWMVYLPLAALGLPPVHYLRHYMINTLYQFWIHTEAIHRMPWGVELVMNTPSHHRMHHMPPGNCNYAGVFILWDRLFGTFVQETHHPLPSPQPKHLLAKALRGKAGYHRGVVYGLANPLNTFDPVYANIQHFVRLWHMVAQKTGLKGIWLAWEWLLVVFGNRVNHPLRIVSDIKELARDVIYDRQLAVIVDKATGPEGLSDKEASALTAICQLPAPLPAIPIQGQDERFTAREIAFLNGREEREGSTRLTPHSRNVLIHHFTWTLVFAYSLMLFHDQPIWFGEKLSLPAQGAVAVMCIWSLQWIKFY